MKRALGLTGGIGAVERLPGPPATSLRLEDGVDQEYSECERTQPRHSEVFGELVHGPDTESPMVRRRGGQEAETNSNKEVTKDKDDRGEAGLIGVHDEKDAETKARDDFERMKIRKSDEAKGSLRRGVRSRHQRQADPDHSDTEYSDCKHLEVPKRNAA